MTTPQPNAELAAPPAEGYAHWDNDTRPKRSRMSVFDGLARGLLSRPIGILGLVGIVVAVFLPPTGIGLSTCGMQTQFGVPCPGCGLTRSVTAFFHGQFAWSWHYHPLGWLFALSFIVVGIPALLPRKPRERLIARLERHDRKIGIALLVFCVVLAAYGLVRIGLVTAGHPDYQWWKEDGKETPPFVRPSAP